MSYLSKHSSETTPLTSQDESGFETPDEDLLIEDFGELSLTQDHGHSASQFNERNYTQWSGELRNNQLRLFSEDLDEYIEYGIGQEMNIRCVVGLSDTEDWTEVLAIATELTSDENEPKVHMLMKHDLEDSPKTQSEGNLPTERGPEVHSPIVRGTETHSPVSNVPESHSSASNVPESHSSSNNVPESHSPVNNVPETLPPHGPKVHLQIKHIPTKSESLINFLNNIQTYLENDMARRLAFRISLACAKGGRRVYNNLQLEDREVNALIPNSFSGGRLNISRFCVIGHYLLKHGKETSSNWYPSRKIYTFIGGPHIWAQRKRGNISETKWRILKQYERVKYDENVMVLVKEVFRL